MESKSAITQGISTGLKNNWEILSILVLATILRTYDLTHIPYMHDELSALIRTKYTNYSDLIEFGVKRLDTHPALIQSFLYFWTKVFGYTEWVVKLPFILMSIASVWFIYRIGTRWYHKTAGLILAILFATMQYTIMYGQIIRPYGSGLFFTLLLTYSWSELVFYSSYKVKHVLGYILGATLCAYNHHFSLLLAAVIGLLGLFFVTKGTRGKYILISLVIPILYLPHLSIFFFHLHVGGVEAWLGKPESSFLWKYLFYLVHYSYLALGILFAVLIAAWIYGKRNFEFHQQTLFSIVLFAVNFAIAYYYSIYGSAVLQSSVLIFSFPFLLLFLVGFINEQSPRFNRIAIGLLGLVFTFTLVVNRQHYSVFYVPPFKQLIWDADYATRHFNQTKTYLFSDELKSRFYEPQLKINPNYSFLKLPDFSLSQLDAELRTNYAKYDHICISVTSGFPPTFRALIQQYYPKLEWEHNYFSANAAVFSKNKSNDKLIGYLELKPEGNWTGIDPQKTGANSKYYTYNSGDEWGPTFHLNLLNPEISPYAYIDVYTTIKFSDTTANPLLVIACQDQDSVFHYSATSAKDLHWNPLDSTLTLVNSLKLIDLHYSRFKQPELNTFIWNTTKKALLVTDFRIIYRRGNPLLYSLYDPIYKLP